MLNSRVPGRPADGPARSLMGVKRTSPGHRRSVAIGPKAEEACASQRLRHTAISEVAGNLNSRTGCLPRHSALRPAIAQPEATGTLAKAVAWLIAVRFIGRIATPALAASSGALALSPAPPTRRIAPRQGAAPGAQMFDADFAASAVAYLAAPSAIASDCAIISGSCLNRELTSRSKHSHYYGHGIGKSTVL